MSLSCDFVHLGSSLKALTFMSVLCHPGRANPSLRCVLMELSRTPQTDSSQPPVCSCSPVQTFIAGSSCKLLTKNTVFKSPAGEGATLVCAGDEATNSTMVRNALHPVTYTQSSPVLVFLIQYLVSFGYALLMKVNACVSSLMLVLLVMRTYSL